MRERWKGGERGERQYCTLILGSDYKFEIFYRGFAINNLNTLYLRDVRNKEKAAMRNRMQGAYFGHPKPQGQLLQI